MKYSNITYRLAAAATAGVLMFDGADAYATAGFNAIAGKIGDSTVALPKLISLVGYIGGAGLSVAGVFKLKNHVDNPGQVPMKDGLVRLGAGGGLLALPAVTAAMQETINTGNTVTKGAMKFDDASFFTTP